MSRLALRIMSAVSIMAFSVSLASASPQVLDKLHYGANIFSIWQLPMSQLWLRDGEPPTRGKIQPPKFQVNSPNNWKGYEAEWEVRNSRLYLRTISGLVDGKKLKKESLLPGFKFPAQATWFTGRIQIAVGDFNQETQEFAAAIVFEIEEGEVTALTFLPSAKINFSLDGMPE